MRKKILLILILLSVFVSFAAAGTHYVVASPLGVRFQNEMYDGTVHNHLPSYQLGVQGFSFLWGENSFLGLGNSVASQARQVVYHPKRYVPAIGISQSIVNSSDDSLHSVGLHFSVDYINLSYHSKIGDSYGKLINQACFQIYGGAAFRQYIIDDMLFIYEATGLSLGMASLGIYGDVGLMYEAPFGLVANIGMRLEVGGALPDRDSYGYTAYGGFAASYGLYAGVGYSF